MKRKRLEGVLGIAILAAIVVLALVLSFVQNDAGDTEDALSSSQPTGRRALWVALEELGFQPRRWDQSPSALPRGRHLLWLARTPTSHMPGTPTESFHPRPGAERVGLHTLDHYRNFVEGGGTLMLRAGEDALEFLADELGFEDCRSITLEETPETGVLTVRTSAGEELAFQMSDQSLFEPLDPNGAACALWSANQENGSRPFVVEVPQGAGTVVLLADDAFVRNEFIGAEDHAVGAVRLVEDVLLGGELLLDEYELGHWSPPSMLAVAVSPPLILASLHFAGLLCFFVWMHAFARAFPRDPEALELFSPLLRARSLGGVLLRARRFGALGALLRRGVFARLVRLAPGSLNAAWQGNDLVARGAGGNEGAAGAPGAVQRITPADVAAFAKAAGLADRAQELELAFVTVPVRTRDDLDALDRELRRIETEIEARLRARAPAVPVVPVVPVMIENARPAPAGVREGT